MQFNPQPPTSWEADILIRKPDFRAEKWRENQTSQT